MTWNRNIDEAPRGRLIQNTSGQKNQPKEILEKQSVIVATRCEKVFVSWCLQDGRWHGFNMDSPPIAWWTEPYPTHPGLEGAT